MRTGNTAIFTILLAGAFLAGAVPAEAQRSCLYFEFEKETNINSTLTWRWTDDYGRCIHSKNWRAGSGTTEDPCQVNHGWLPNGWYDLTSVGHVDGYDGSAIWGRVWGLQDKKCADGTWRTALFIHTEETAANGQVCTAHPDDPKCWDSTRANPSAGIGTNDYQSLGCIKVRRQSPEGDWPNVMGAVHSAWHDAGLGKAAGRTDAVWVHK